jgi:hypothetical protein
MTSKPRGVAELDDDDAVFGALAHRSRRTILAALHGRVLARVLVAALSPGEDLDVGKTAVVTAIDNRRLVGHEAELVQDWPVAPEQGPEVALRLRPDAERPDHSLISHEAKY